MAQRQVTRTRKDRDGDITAICKPQERWSPRRTSDAVRDINSGRHSYYVRVDGHRVDIYAVDGHLSTEPDEVVTNNLDNLPDC